MRLGVYSGCYGHRSVGLYGGDSSEVRVPRDDGGSDEVQSYEYGFGEELINHFLRNKILGKTWLVDDAISEINICSYEPICLPSLSKIESKDLVWYFFSPKEYTSAKKKVTKRTTISGYWKATSVDRKIKDKRGNRGEIGIKKTLVYYYGRVPNGVWTPWVLIATIRALGAPLSSGD